MIVLPYFPFINPYDRKPEPPIKIYTRDVILYLQAVGFWPVTYKGNTKARHLNMNRLFVGDKPYSIARKLIMANFAEHDIKIPRGYLRGAIVVCIEKEYLEKFL